MLSPRPLHLGAVPSADGSCRFRVWAPAATAVAVAVEGPGEVRHEPLSPLPGGCFEGVVAGVGPGSRYRYRLDGGDALPDPASRSQPDGVHGASEVVDTAFPWRHDFRGLPLAQHVFYELHVGTFTAEGTFDAVIPRLPRLVDLGVTALELMPIAQFPGRRNWGYDGAYPFAAQASYGGLAGLQRLVDAAHGAGLAVFLDVVYNHLGPEGNYLSRFGPYFTDRYRTPWGRALNFDGVDSDGVRDYFVENALFWVTAARLDGLRLDAVHAILDHSERPFLAELAAAVHAQADALGRRVHLVAESENNTLHYLRPREQGGCGIDGQWADDFHHAVHAALTGERSGYYADFGRLAQVAKGYADGFVYTGEYSPARRRRHGVPAGELGDQRLVGFVQNHDQTGNRCHGERLAGLVGFAQLRLAAATLLLSPYLPLLFMGEEYGEEAPFLYFVDHSDPALVAAVCSGRRSEFAAFHAGDEVPDPAAAETYERSILRWGERSDGRAEALFAWYRELLRLRRSEPALGPGGRASLRATADEESGLLAVERRRDGDAAHAWLNFGGEPVPARVPDGEGWELLLDSAATSWGGPGSAAPERPAAGVELVVPAHGVLVYRRGVGGPRRSH